MADIKSRIKFKRATTTSIAASTDNLLPGAPVFNTDTGELLIGNSTTPVNSGILVKDAKNIIDGGTLTGSVTLNGTLTGGNGSTSVININSSTGLVESTKTNAKDLEITDKLYVQGSGSLNSGTDKQILAIDTNGKPRWKSPIDFYQGSSYNVTATLTSTSDDWDVRADSVAGIDGFKRVYSYSFYDLYNQGYISVFQTFAFNRSLYSLGMGIGEFIVYCSQAGNSTSSIFYTPTSAKALPSGGGNKYAVRIDGQFSLQIFTTDTSAPDSSIDIFVRKILQLD